MKRKFFMGILGLSIVLLPGCGKANEDGAASPSQPATPSQAVTPDADAPTPSTGAQTPTSAADSPAATDGQAAAYGRIYLPKVTETTEEDAVFSLILLDGDDIPELVVSHPGSNACSIYTVKDEAIHCMANFTNTASLTYFEQSSILADFASWNGGGDEGGYGTDYYQASKDVTLADDSSPVLGYSYNATYDDNGAYTGTGVTNYYYMGQETDLAAYQEQLAALGITEGSDKLCWENALGKEEMAEFLNQ